MDYQSFTDHEGMEGWVGLPTVDSTNKVVTGQSEIGHRHRSPNVWRKGEGITLIQRHKR